MTQGKHTPGPWRVGMDSEWSIDTDGENSFIHIGPETGDPVAIAIVGSSWGQDDVLDANAALIAAAPDMLEALRAVLDLHLAHHNHPTHAAARAAIFKATGGQS